MGGWPGPAGRVPVRRKLTGAVLASQFDDIPASDQARLRVDKVALEVPPAYQAAPGDPAAPGQPCPAQW